MKQISTIELFKDNPYQKNCPSKIIDATDNWIQLDQTIFYAQGGGQLGDTGILKTENDTIKVENTIRENNSIKHLINNDVKFKIGDSVECFLDWERRYKLMKIHTCLHLLCSIIDGKVTGGSVNDGKGRLDFNLDHKPNKDEVKIKLNKLIQGNYNINYSWISQKELDENPNLIKTMSVLPPRTNGKIRMVRIGEDIDYQPCGGTHVKNTSEIGNVEIYKIENKGKLNKRIALSLT